MLLEQSNTIWDFVRLEEEARFGNMPGKQLWPRQEACAVERVIRPLCKLLGQPGAKFIPTDTSEAIQGFANGRGH